MINIKKLKSLIAFLLGMTSTMPIVGIVIMGRDISIYRILFIFIILSCGIEIIKARKIAIYTNNKKIIIWLIESLISCLCGWIFLNISNQPWSNAAFSYIPKVLILILFAMFWGSSKEWRSFGKIVISGFFAGCLLNCIWSIIDAAGFYLFGRSINNILFSGYISRNNIRFSSLSLIYSGFIRSSGFNSDPAQIGYIAPIIAGLAIYKKKYWLMLIVLGSILASASTTALVTSIIISIISFVLSGKRINLNVKSIIISSILILIFSIFIIIFKDYVFSITNSAFTRFYSRINQIYLNADSGTGNARIDYILCFPYALSEVIPFSLFGSGFGTSSLGYALSEHAYSILGNRVNSAYDMENTYLAFFFDTGIIGIVLFLSIIFRLLKEFKARLFYKNDIDIVILMTIISSVISMLFYHYILFAPQLLVFTISLSLLDNDGGYNEQKQIN